VEHQHPTSRSTPNKERAHAPTSIDIDSKNRLKESIERLRSAQKTDYDANVFETARDALQSFQAKCSRPENRIGTAPDDKITAQFLSVAEWPRLRQMLAELEAERTEAGFKWVWFVRVALQRMQGLSPSQWTEVCAQVWPSRTLAERKPPVREEETSDALALREVAELKEWARAAAHGKAI
jgi:hypothetical protein